MGTGKKQIKAYVGEESYKWIRAYYVASMQLQVERGGRKISFSLWLEGLLMELVERKGIKSYVEAAYIDMYEKGG